MIVPIPTELANNIISPCEAANEFPFVITAHIAHYGILCQCKRELPTLLQNHDHCDCGTVWLTGRIAWLKKSLRKWFPVNGNYYLRMVCPWLLHSLIFRMLLATWALIRDMPSHIRLPEQLTSYLIDGYTKFSGSIKTKEWWTPTFNIRHGVFHGDTLSPLIFLNSFIPLVEPSQSVPSPFASQFRTHKVTPIKLSDLCWMEGRTVRWTTWFILCNCQLDGCAKIEYADMAMETLNLHEVNWEFTRKDRRHMISHSH